jgi:hypothetical protein
LTARPFFKISGDGREAAIQLTWLELLADAWQASSHLGPLPRTCAAPNSIAEFSRCALSESQGLRDWRELQSWQIGESRLPAGSTIRFREHTVRERYRWQAALISAIILVQGSPISTLLFERRRRCFAEVQSRQRMAELAHTNRDSMAGELTASIAHELISHSEPSSPMPRRRN